MSETARPKTRRGARRREQILRAAETVFGERGFTASSIADIMGVAEGALGTFYIYFSSKEEVFRELVLEMGQHARAMATQAVAGAPSRLEAERAGLAAFLHFVRARPALYRIVEEARFVDPDAYRSYFTGFAMAYRRHLAEAEAAGDLPPGDAEIRAWALMGMAKTLGERFALWDPDADIDRVVDEAFGLIRDGLAPREAPRPEADFLPDMAAKQAELAPHKMAFRDRGAGRDWTFAQVNAAADAVAAGFVAAGLQPGDRVAILTLNRAEFFITLFACQKTGIILCPLNWRQTVGELADTLDPVTPSALIHDSENGALARDLGVALGVALYDLDSDVAGWIAKGGKPLRASVPAVRPWYLLFTSGTTGPPKPVIQTARMAWASAVNIAQAVGLTDAARSVNYLPLAHTAGINLHTLPVFLFGGSSTILRRFEPEALLDLIRQGAVNQFFGVPAIYRAFSLLPETRDIDWSAVRCACGGAPLPEPLIRLFDDLGARVLNGLGMTETGPTVFLMDEEGARERIGSVGKAQALTEMRLDGVADGAPGQGEILLRGPNITPGYWGDPDATRAAFDGEGWLRTGDVGRRDADGYVFVVDRIGDMFISGGENVYPAEVERVLNDHPDILESAVIGVPDARWGEVGAAFAILHSGATPDAAQLRDWCRARLAGFKVPARIVLVDDFPRTAAGKVRKAKLREMLE